MPQYYVEIRAGVRRNGPPRLVPLEQVHLYTGFRSVMAYDEETKQAIEERGDTKFLRGTPVYADVLFMDFDDYDPQQFIQALKKEGYGFDVYFSGNRSVHIHIPIVAVYDVALPQMMKQWVEQHAPRADTSFYHPGGQYRLPGTFHPKTGKRKELIETHEGRVLELPRVDVPRFDFLHKAESTPEQFFCLLLQPVMTGGRRPHIWKLATVACEAGLGFDETVERIAWWNEHYCQPPHDDTTIVRQVESAFSRLRVR